MSNNDDDDDRTEFVSSPRPTTAAPDHDDAGSDHDKTVMMKPTQRNREASAALSTERARQSKQDRAATDARTAAATVDFDVVSGAPTAQPHEVPARRQRSGPNYAWIAGFVGTLAVAGLCLWLVFFLK